MSETPKLTSPQTLKVLAQKSNTTLIAILVIIGVLLIGGIGSCLVIRSCPNQVTTKGIENALEKTTSTDINTEEEKVSVKNEKRSLEIDSKKLPEGFANQIPVYTSTSVESSSKYEDNEKGITYVVKQTTNDSYNTVRAFFKSNLPSHGWPIISEVESTAGGNKTITFTFNTSRDPGEGWIVITQEDDKVTIGYSVTIKK